MQRARIRAARRLEVQVSAGTLRRWEQASPLAACPGPVRPGPKRASKLMAQVAAQIRRLGGQGLTLTEIAAAIGVSTFRVSNALGRVPAKSSGCRR